MFHLNKIVMFKEMFDFQKEPNDHLISENLFEVSCSASFRRKMDGEKKLQTRKKKRRTLGRIFQDMIETSTTSVEIFLAKTCRRSGLSIICQKISNEKMARTEGKPRKIVHT